MLQKIIQAPAALGLELNGHEIRAAKVSFRLNKPQIQEFFSLPTSSNVKPLYIDSPILVTGLQSGDVLVRPFALPLTKEKDVAAALAFQAEPLLPYPPEQALLARHTLSQNAEGTQLTLLATCKDLLQAHIEAWQALQIEPEKVSCTQAALCQFAKFYVKAEKPLVVLHLNENWMTCVLVQEGKLIAAYAHHEGLNLLPANDSQEALAEEPLKRLEQGIAKICYALLKDYKAESLEGLILTGDAISLLDLPQRLSLKLNLPLLQSRLDIDPDVSAADKQRHALPIGLAISAFEGGVDFRQQEFSYPHPWKHVKAPLMAYFVLMCALTLSAYFFGQVYLVNQEDRIKQEYVDLLAAMSKPYDQFELAFLTKNPQDKKETNAIAHLQREDLLKRLNFLYKDLQAAPDSFPLFANLPTVSDVLAWISTHPNVVHQNEEGTKETRLQLENFSYNMLKRPSQGKKQEKYQVKVELEFSSPKPKWAREFHDALIAANDFVDSKAEVKWSSNRGHYRTSFYVKDKTLYPGQ
jgi:type IV pilus assembly protein PilM